MKASPSNSGEFSSGAIGRLHAHTIRWRYAYALLFSLVIAVSSSMPVHIPHFAPYPDKWMHVIFFFALGLAYLNVTTRGWRQGTVWRLAAGLAAVVAFGALDEWHQMFVPGRIADANDVIADGIGGVLAVGVSMPIVRRLRSRG